MVECILGRLLTGDETVDHIDGVTGNNVISNLAPLFGRDNKMKANIRLITRIDSAGNAVVYGGNSIQNQLLDQIMVTSLLA